ncbi:hypothetical protein QFC21_002250 [Naganishia friedmannii]|uniref:Uncharacterized protein n=1 Tax=Naganishia friedmannii TaxID=89922 RepID=A0ACC2VXA5_9TREE|nr:hypothetical protein QFC21_002250 [Naganishia friedmannii]
MTMTSSTPITIRPAKDDEYLEATRVLFAALISTPLFKHLVSKVDQSIWFEFSAAQIKQSVEEKYSSLLVAQRIDTGELVGVIWSERFNKDHQPKLPSCQFPEGFNRNDFDLMAEHELEFPKQSVANDGDVVYVTEPGVAPNSQGQGIGRRMIDLIIVNAKRSGLNIILPAGSGVSGFYEKFGFEVVGKPVMLGDGTIEGPTPMRLELFHSKEGRSDA